VVGADDRLQPKKELGNYSTFIKPNGIQAYTWAIDQVLGKAFYFLKKKKKKALGPLFSCHEIFFIFSLVFVFIYNFMCQKKKTCDEKFYSKTLKFIEKNLINV